MTYKQELSFSTIQLLSFFCIGNPIFEEVEEEEGKGLRSSTVGYHLQDI